MIKENVLKTLSTLGFRPEEVEGFGYRFEYECFTIIYSEEDEDTKTVTLASPGVFEITPENRTAVLEAMVRLAGKVKFVQPFIMFEDHVWLNYQHYLGENEVTPELIEHMIRVLTVSTVQFHKIINGEEQ